MSSPLRKRQKLDTSSPVCPELELSQDDLKALDEIERRLSQTSHSAQHDSPSKPPKLPSFDSAENPFHLSSPAPAFSGFTAASAISLAPEDADFMDRLSPDPPEERDYSAWFESTRFPAAVGFQTAQSASLFSTASALVDKEQLSALGFRTVGKGADILAPSASALAKAREKLKLWQDEEEEEDHAPPQDTLLRMPLRSVQHSITEPETPWPPHHSSGFTSASRLSDSVAHASTKSSAFVSPVVGKAKSQNIDPNRPKPFKSPLVINSRAPTTPVKPASSTFTSPRFQRPLAASPSYTSFQTPFSSKFVPSSSSTHIIAPSTSKPPASATPTNFTTPARRVLDNDIAPAGRIRTTPAKFVTPFKKGMKPGEVGRAELDAKSQKQSRIPTKNTSTVNFAAKMIVDLDIPGVFDMTPPPKRLSLMESGLLPGQHTAEEMSIYNVIIEELSQISTPSLALYYSFYTTPQPSDDLSIHSEGQIDPSVALAKLLAYGCSRATKAWVDNAWCLILWKLAGMVALEPERETRSPSSGKTADGPRWCWHEVWRQLLYRYEREINLGVRPPFHLITTQDHPASPPMVLCISNIIWPEASISPGGQRINPLPQIEVTDGWYLLKAQIDLSMASAVKRGKLRVGRKIAVVGARLDAERKDPLEPLEAYQSTKLILSGNSSQLAPWHAKLGFQRGPYIFTMHSLTPEGGNVASMDLVVLQVHPIAYLETRIGPDGKKYQEGPRAEAEEIACKDKWRKRREAAESKIYEAHEKKVVRYLSYAERLDQKTARCALSEDPPDNVDTLYDELEESDDAGQIISQTKGSEAAWLAKYIRERLEKDRERVKEELEKEVDDLCPPRNVRSFRVVIAQDSRTSKFPANRVAQLTIWDVLDLKLTENKPRGHFEVGWRCLVTNLMPSSKAAWMGNEPESQIFLVTTRSSRWQQLKRAE